MFLSCNSIFSQEDVKTSPFSSLQIGVYGGINFETFSEKSGSFIFEGKTNLTPKLNLKLSFGYYKSLQLTNYTVKSYGEHTIDSVTFYTASSYDVTKKIFDVFPFSLGLQYILINSVFSPYLTLDGSYNLISPSINRTGGYVWYYGSVDEIPDEFKTQLIREYPSDSFGLSMGAGGIYKISSKIGLDLRYFYKYDGEIASTHHILIGIVF